MGATDVMNVSEDFDMNARYAKPHKTQEHKSLLLQNGHENKAATVLLIYTLNRLTGSHDIR